MTLFKNILNLFVRIPFATLLIHYFSHWMYSHERVQQMIQLFTGYPQFQFEGRAAKDLKTIQKMFKFWPPHQGTGYGEFSLVFTISLLLFIRLIDIPTVFRAVFGWKYTSKTLNFVLTPLYASIIPFILLFPMMRLAEMHFFVLILNYLHILGSSYIVYAVWYFLNNESKKEEEKTKTE